MTSIMMQENQNPVIPPVNEADTVNGTQGNGPAIATSTPINDLNAQQLFDALANNDPYPALTAAIKAAASNGIPLPVDGGVPINVVLDGPAPVELLQLDTGVDLGVPVAVGEQTPLDAQQLFDALANNDPDPALTAAIKAAASNGIPLPVDGGVPINVVLDGPVPVELPQLDMGIDLGVPVPVGDQTPLDAQQLFDSMANNDPDPALTAAIGAAASNGIPLPVDGGVPINIVLDGPVPVELPQLDMGIDLGVPGLEINFEPIELTGVEAISIEPPLLG